MSPLATSLQDPASNGPTLMGATPDSAARQSLDAQAALLPYALIAFGVGLPIFTWACSFAPDRAWMTASFAIFAINWAAFYGVVDHLRRQPERRANIALRGRIQVLGGLLWATAVAQICAIGEAAGPAREPILLMAAGVAAMCVFFSAPYLPALLIVGPAAAAAPLWALYADPATRAQGRLAIAATALALALSLVLNQLLRGLFVLADDRERLLADHARSLTRFEQLARSKSDLIATLSNEIRNGLIGVTHVLAAACGAGGRAAPSREQLAAALSSAQDLTTVLNATLDSETAEAGRLDVTPRPFNPTCLIEELVLLHRPQAAAKGLELSAHIEDALGDPSLGGVLADGARVRQILANLIGNAIKYTMRGRIEIRAERLSLERARFEVADTGPGLTPEELDRAFTAFSRIERTGAGVPGAGLGLSLSRRLAGLMGGQLSAESALGVGSCFRLDLPYDPNARCAEPSEPALLRRPAALRVLLAEDDALSAAMLRSALEQLGHRVVQAQTGRRACDLAQSCELDLIVLNSRLASTDGAETIRAIRRLDGPAAEPAIIAVIDGDPEEARACLAAGADEVLRRPVNVASLARGVAAALRAGRPRRAAA